ncbi:hypothetical protein Halar_0298 (plasmid) [halophilic archaeon DL31]|nr:hypothetical protein Halar_0298 [halophilic archaeon DL31]
MAGGTTVTSTGAVAELLATGQAQGSLIAPELAAILYTDGLSVAAEREWSVGEPSP